MFATSFATPQPAGGGDARRRRMSIGDLVPNTQSADFGLGGGFGGGLGDFGSFRGGTQAAGEGGRAPRQGVRGLDGGVVPVTVAQLRRGLDAVFAAPAAHGATRLVSLVGWPTGPPPTFSSVSVECDFADGSGTLRLQLDVPSGREQWMLPRLREILGGAGDAGGKAGGEAATGDPVASRAAAAGDGASDSDEKENVRAPAAPAAGGCPGVHYVRVIATASGAPLTGVLRVIHIHPAAPAEAAYYHTLEVVHAYLTSGGAASSAPAPDAETEGPAKAAVPGIAATLAAEELPPKYETLTDATEVAVLKYVLKFRKAEVGVCREKLLSDLKSAGYEPDDVRQSLADLNDRETILMLAPEDAKADDDAAWFVDAFPDDEEAGDR